MASTEGVFFGAAGAALIILLFLLSTYVGDEVWRRRYAAQDRNMQLFSYQSIVLKLALLAMLVLVVAHQVRPEYGASYHLAIVVIMLVLTMYRLFGRQQIYDYQRRRNRRSTDRPTGDASTEGT